MAGSPVPAPVPDVGMSGLPTPETWAAGPLARNPWPTSPMVCRQFSAACRIRRRVPSFCQGVDYKPYAFSGMVHTHPASGCKIGYQGQI